MIYLDNSATTRPFDSVVEAAVRSMREQYFNASAAYKPAVDVDREIRACRKCIAAQVGAREDEVIFTAGGTESDNLAILGYAMTLHQSANFVVSSLEHPAVGETVQRVRRWDMRCANCQLTQEALSILPRRRRSSTSIRRSSAACR